jgi:hypothetical protein
MTLLKSILSILKILLKSSFWNGFKAHIPSSNNKILLLGNGPSLKITLQEHKEYLKNYDLLAFNNFAITPEFETLKPRYYLIHSPILFENEVISEFYLNMRNQLFESIENKIDWHFYLIVPFFAEKSVYFKAFRERNKSKIAFLYFNTTPIEGVKSINNLLFNLKLGSPRPHNVMIPSILCSIYMKYKEIYIVGADHNWFGEFSTTDDNVVLVNQKHFYDESTSTPQPMNDYIVRSRRMHEILHKFQLTFFAYFVLNDFAEFKKVKIYNASHSSLIDAFERKKLNAPPTDYIFLMDKSIPSFAQKNRDEFTARNVPSNGGMEKKWITVKRIFRELFDL